jgi:hypothetical protein
MQTRRLIVVGVSLLIGAVATWVTIYLSIPLGPVTIGFGTNAHDFAYSNVVILFISIACIVGIWLDYFLSTNILKS